MGAAEKNEDNPWSLLKQGTAPEFHKAYAGLRSRIFRQEDLGKVVEDTATLMHEVENHELYLEGARERAQDFVKHVRQEHRLHHGFSKDDPQSLVFRRKKLKDSHGGKNVRETLASTAKEAMRAYIKKFAEGDKVFSAWIDKIAAQDDKDAAKVLAQQWDKLHGYQGDEENKIPSMESVISGLYEGNFDDRTVHDVYQTLDTVAQTAVQKKPQNIALQTLQLIQQTGDITNPKYEEQIKKLADKAGLKIKNLSSALYRGPTEVANQAITKLREGKQEALQAERNPNSLLKDAYSLNKAA